MNIAMNIKRYFVIADLILIAAVAYFTVDLFYRFVNLKVDTAPTHQAGDVKGSVGEKIRKPALSAYAPISNRNLFKVTTVKQVEPSKPEPKAENIKDMEETRLKVKLWGTVWGENAQKTYAVIEDQIRREQSLYQEGDMIQTAIVKKILREKVILNVNGKDEILFMEDNTQGRRLGKAITPQKSPVRKVSSVPPGQNRVTLHRSQITSAVRNIHQLLRQAKIQSRPDGLTLSRIRPNSIFTRLGLKDGDVIKGVDGRSIKSVDDALAFYNSLKDSSSVNLLIKREGMLQTINYEIE